MIKALLCDFDGTIVNSLWLYPKAYRQALNKFGFNVSDEWIYEHCFGRTEQVICRELGISGKLDEFKSIYLSAADNFSGQSQLFPGVIDVLNLAKEKQIKLGIISFAYRRYLDKMLPVLLLKEYFDIIIGFEDVENSKPAPDAVIEASNKLHVSLSECLIIGDSKNDILMGKNAGAKTALFYPQEHEKIYSLGMLRQTNPDHIITEWQQLPEILKNENN